MTRKKVGTVLLAAFIAVIILFFRKDGRFFYADISNAATIESGVLETATTETYWAGLNEDGAAQSFRIPSSVSSPTCFGGTQQVRIDSIEVRLLAPGLGECGFWMNAVEILVRETRNGQDLGRAVPNYKLSQQPQWIGVNFHPPLFLSTNTQYYLVVRHDNYRTHSWNRSLPYYYSRKGGNASATATPTPSGACPAIVPPFPHYVAWGIESPGQYQDGEYDIPNQDGRARIYYSFASQVKVLAMHYDPPMGEVTFTDDVGTVPTHDYHGERLHALKFTDSAGQTITWHWKDPSVLAETMAQQLRDASGGAVEFSLQHKWLDEWTPHESGTARWANGNISPFTEWSEDTWPGYPHIPVDRRTLRVDTPPPNYTQIMMETLDGTILQAVQAGEIDEIWVFTDTTSRLSEATLIEEPNAGHVNPRSVGWVAGMARIAILMGLSFQAPVGNSLHSYGHRAETYMAAQYNGNTSAMAWCHINVSEDNIFNKYIKIFGCYEHFVTPEPPQHYGGIGTIHKPHNGIVDDPFNLSEPQLHNSATPAPSDEREWLEDFPNLTGGKVANLACNDGRAWKCNTTEYFRYWFRHLPRASGRQGEGGPFNNVWPLIAKPSCFPNQQNYRSSPAPTPSATP